MRWFGKMKGILYISEFNCYGDPTASLVLEPSTLVQQVPLGELSDRLHKDTRLVTLWCPVACKVCFFAEGDLPSEERATPMSEAYEITRMIHMGSNLRVAVYPL